MSSIVKKCRNEKKMNTTGVSMHKKQKNTNRKQGMQGTLGCKKPHEKLKDQEIEQNLCSRLRN